MRLQMIKKLFQNTQNRKYKIGDQVDFEHFFGEKLKNGIVIELKCDHSYIVKFPYDVNDNQVEFLKKEPWSLFKNRRQFKNKHLFWEIEEQFLKPGIKLRRIQKINKILKQ